MAWERLGAQAEIIDFFSDLYGRYPFTSGGGIVDNAAFVGYALESQTRANYQRVPPESTVVHEIAQLLGRREQVRQRHDGRLHRAG